MNPRGQRSGAKGCRMCATVRCAVYDELEAVAEIQLDVFAPEPPPPSLLPILASIFKSNQQTSRRMMRTRLAQDLRARVDKGSRILVAAAPAGDPCGDVVGGQYEESRELTLLGTVDLSTQEMELPTHSLCDGMYLSHMAVVESFRRQGLGMRLLLAAEEEALQLGAEGIYLHVERENDAAIRLYKSAGFHVQSGNARHETFTRALKLATRDPLLMYKRIS